MIPFLPVFGPIGAPAEFREIEPINFRFQRGLAGGAARLQPAWLKPSPTSI
jgi:hypothetical protein